MKLSTCVAMVTFPFLGGVLAQDSDKEIDLNSIKSKGLKGLVLIPAEKSEPKKRPVMSFGIDEGQIIEGGEMKFEMVEVLDDEWLAGMWHYTFLGKKKSSKILLEKFKSGVKFPIKTPPIEGKVGLFRTENGAESVKELWDKIIAHSEEKQAEYRLNALTDFQILTGADKLSEIPAWRGKMRGQINGEIVLIPVSEDLMQGFWMVTSPELNGFQEIINFELFVLDRLDESAQKKDAYE